MTDDTNTVPEPVGDDVPGSSPEKPVFYKIRFREDGQQFTAVGPDLNLPPGSVVMVATDHGGEPATVTGHAPICGCGAEKSRASFEIERVCSDAEQEKLTKISENEKRAFNVCNELIKRHQLKMHLVRVEKFFNGGKVIFYFTADNRVDFRGLVKDLVQEFRTRVEMRQVGVRHETKMVGGIGTCGRELCCSSFIKKFDSVSIKMAKEQDLPLNPTKISGVCNRLLCCLTYEYGSYKKQRKNMPRVGKHIIVDNKQYLVKRQQILQEAVVVENSNGDEMVLKKSEWHSYQTVKHDSPLHKGGRKGGDAQRQDNRENDQGKD
jgi:cell fate regulator YaaT (PSP1 superfamily)